jgi:hypothetical protein
MGYAASVPTEAVPSTQDRYQVKDSANGCKIVNCLMPRHTELLIDSSLVPENHAPRTSLPLGSWRMSIRLQKEAASEIL